MSDSKDNVILKFACEEKFSEDLERRTGMYSNVHEDSSTKSTNKLPLQLESCIHNLARAVIIDQGKILLCRTVNKIYRSQGWRKKDLPDFYFLPGGHIENKESAKDALLRELKEEIGFDFNVGRFLGTIEFICNIEHEMYHDQEYNFCYEANCNEIKSDESITQIEEHIELLWVDINELPEINIRPKIIIEALPIWLESNFEDSFKSQII